MSVYSNAESVSSWDNDLGFIGKPPNGKIRTPVESALERYAKKEGERKAIIWLVIGIGVISTIIIYFLNVRGVMLCIPMIIAVAIGLILLYYLRGR